MLYKDQYNTIKLLSVEEKAELLDAIYQYQLWEPEINLSDKVALVFSMIKTTFERDQEKYEEKCRRNAENARKRWDAKGATASDGIKSHANDADSDSDIDSDRGRDIKEEQNTFCTSESFAKFWNKYPNKKWKQKAKKLFSSKIKSQKKFEELMQWLSWYIDDHERKEITWEFCPDYQQWDTFMSKETRVDYLDMEKQEDNPYELFCKLVYPHWDFATNMKGEKKYIEKYGVDKLKEMDRIYKDEMFLSLAKW